jgi:hypothetical protein
MPPSQTKRKVQWDNKGPLAHLLQSLLEGGNIPKNLSTAKVVERYPQFGSVPDRNFASVLSRYRSKYCVSTIEENIAKAEARLNNHITSLGNTSNVPSVRVVDLGTTTTTNNNNNNNIEDTIESNNILQSLSKYG